MDREILSIFLQSGPARKFDVSRFTKIITTTGEAADQSFLFRNKFLNHTILFKCIILEDYAKHGREKHEYRDTYSDLVYNGEIGKFSKFLLKCKQAYWELGDLLGRFEQTAIAWRVFNATYQGKRIPFPVLINFFVLLRQLHDAPPQVSSSDIDDRPAERTGFPHFAPNLF